MKTMEQRPLQTPPQSARYSRNAIVDNLDVNKGIKWGGGIIGAGALLYWTAPEVHNLITQRQNLLGLILFGGGVALAASKNERGHVSFRDRPLGRNAAIVVGSGMALVGGALAANNLYGEMTGDDKASEQTAEIPTNVTIVPGDTIVTENTMVVESPTTPGCELILDFNNVPQADIDSGRNVADARRLQYIAYEMGGYSEFGATGDFSETEKETYIDGFLGPQSGTAVANLRTSIGLPPADPSWGAEMCSAIPTLSDGNPNTPSFPNMPELRFEGYQG